MSVGSQGSASAVIGCLPLSEHILPGPRTYFCQKTTFGQAREDEGRAETLVLKGGEDGDGGQAEASQSSRPLAGPGSATWRRLAVQVRLGKADLLLPG